MSGAASPASPLVAVEEIHTYYGKSHILHGVSLTVGAGEVVGLLGRNGVGKSTTLKTVMGLVRPSQGEVRYEGRAITGLAPHRLARLGIAYVPEDRRIFRLLTVMENLRTGLDRAGLDEARKQALLDKVYRYFPVLADRGNQAGGTLSGGEQQMLAIARAMMLEPKIILLDEPTAGVSPVMTEALAQTILKLRNQGLTFAIIEHDMDVIAQLCAPIFVLAEGRTLMRGTFREVASNGEVMSAYLGKAA